MIILVENEKNGKIAEIFQYKVVGFSIKQYLC